MGGACWTATFGKVERKNLLLTVGEILTIDEVLPASSVTETVEVSGESPILDTQKTEVSQTFDPTLLVNLPVATRNWSAFVLNTPNVVQDGGSGLVSFHGISGLYNQNYVDGANNLQLLGRVRPGRWRSGQRHHQERHQRDPWRPVLPAPLPGSECA